MRKPKILIIDDEKYYRDSLCEFLLREADVEAFESPDAFAEIYTEPKSIKDIALIILDFRFDSYDASDKDIVTYLREDLKFRGKIVLWSLEDDVPSEFSKHLDAVLPKKILSLAEIDECTR